MAKLIFCDILHIVYLIIQTNMQGYCVKCKKKREIEDAQEVKMKNGRPAMKGKCGTCGTGMYRILPTKK